MFDDHLVCEPKLLDVLFPHPVSFVLTDGDYLPAPDHEEMRPSPAAAASYCPDLIEALWSAIVKNAADAQVAALRRYGRRRQPRGRILLVLRNGTGVTTESQIPRYVLDPFITQWTLLGLAEFSMAFSSTRRRVTDDPSPGC